MYVYRAVQFLSECNRTSTAFFPVCSRRRVCSVRRDLQCDRYCSPDFSYQFDKPDRLFIVNSLEGLIAARYHVLALVEAASAGPTTVSKRDEVTAFMTDHFSRIHLYLNSENEKSAESDVENGELSRATRALRFFAPYATFMRVYSNDLHLLDAQDASRPFAFESLEKLVVLTLPKMQFSSKLASSRFPKCESVDISCEIPSDVKVHLFDERIIALRCSVCCQYMNGCIELDSVATTPECKHSTYSNYLSLLKTVISDTTVFPRLEEVFGPVPCYAVENVNPFLRRIGTIVFPAMDQLDRIRFNRAVEWSECHDVDTVLCPRDYYSTKISLDALDFMAGNYKIFSCFRSDPKAAALSLQEYTRAAVKAWNQAASKCKSIFQKSERVIFDITPVSERTLGLMLVESRAVSAIAAKRCSRSPANLHIGYFEFEPDYRREKTVPLLPSAFWIIVEFLHLNRVGKLSTTSDYKSVEMFEAFLKWRATARTQAALAKHYLGQALEEHEQIEVSM